MKIERMILATLFAAATPSALAGPNGTLLCDGSKPYDFLVSEQRTFSRFAVRSSTAYAPQPASGKLIDGQGVKALSANGLMLIPTEVAGRGQVELRKQGRTLARIPGWLQSWDLWGDGKQEKFTFVIFNGDEVSPAVRTLPMTRYIVGDQGQILLKKDFRDSSDSESGLPLLAFTADGHALYEQVNATDPVRSRRSFSTSDLREIADITAPKDQLIFDLVMVSGDEGFAIIGGQLQRYSQHRFTPIELGAPLEARTLDLDPRSGRVLVRGRNDFVVLDLTGAQLFRYAGDFSPEAAGSTWVHAKLAIDGSVGFLRDSDDFALIATRKSGYSQIRHLPLMEEDWNRVECFTPNSAALLVDDQPVLVKF